MADRPITVLLDETPVLDGRAPIEWPADPAAAEALLADAHRLADERARMIGGDRG